MARMLDDLDFATAGELDRALATQGRSACLVVVDLREIAFTDAGGLGVLLRADVNARRAGIGFWLISGECVRRMLAVAGVTTQFTYGDLVAAVMNDPIDEIRGAIPAMMSGRSPTAT